MVRVVLVVGCGSVLYGRTWQVTLAPSIFACPMYYRIGFLTKKMVSLVRLITKKMNDNSTYTRPSLIPRPCATS